jgi:two-component system osmolarity sensor histidine kinase EnvZ
MNLRRFDSLFLRLLLAQLLLVAAAMAIFSWLLIVERNQAMAVQYATRWAPTIALAARQAQGCEQPPHDMGSGIRCHQALAAGLKLPVSRMPAVDDFARALARHGMRVDEVWLARGPDGPKLWARMSEPGSPPVWLEGTLPPEVLPSGSLRMKVCLTVLAAAVAWASWRFARRVTRPLEHLRQRMQVHAGSGIAPALPPAGSWGKRASPELVAIDLAYRQLAERLQRTERERALLLAGVSHDLRSPLSRIRLAAEMLPETADNAAGVSSITRNVDHADRLTASFLEFVRAGTVALDETVDLADIVRQAVAGQARPEAELRSRLPDSVLLHQAHGLLLQRAITNLVENALKHGGTPVEVSLLAEGDTALLIVADSGPGLPPDSAGRMVEAFARGDPSRNTPGFGLGLAITQQLVLRLKGELSFRMQGGQHQVLVRLPLQR